MRVFVVEISPTVAADGSTATYLFGTDAWATKPSDTPANTPVRPLLKSAGTVRRELFSGARVTGAITPSYGNIVLANPAPEDGAPGDLDDWLGYGISGSKIIVRWGEIGDAYPAGWTTVYIAYAHSMVADVSEITIRLRDRLQLLDQPVVVDGFAGTGGLEGNGGVSRRKQHAFLEPGFIPPILVDVNKQIYFLTAGGTGGLQDSWKLTPDAETNPFDVFDNGVKLTRSDTDYSSEAQILGSAPAEGYVKYWFGTQSTVVPGWRNGPIYFRLGSPPAGDIRVNATSYPNDEDHNRRGRPAGSWSIGTMIMRAGIPAADIESESVGGFYRLVAEEETYLEVLADCALATNSWFGFTRLDKFRSGLLLDPESKSAYYNCPASSQSLNPTTSVYTFVSDQVKTLRREPPAGMEVPIWKASFEVGETWPSEVANAATDKVRDYLTREPAWTSFQGVSTTALLANPGAGAAHVKVNGLFVNNQFGATLMAQRYLALYGGRRDFWTFTVPMADDVLALELHDVVTLQAPRFGLSAGKKHRIVGITLECNARVPQMKFILWGGQTGLWTGSTGGPGTPGYKPPGGGGTSITTGVRNAIGDFTGYMFGTVNTTSSTGGDSGSAIAGSIGDFTGYILARVLSSIDLLCSFAIREAGYADLAASYEIVEDVGSGWDTSQTGGAHTSVGQYLSSNGSAGRSYSVAGNSTGKRYAEVYVTDGYSDGSFGSPMVGVTRQNSGTDNQQIYFNGSSVYAGWTSGSANPARYGREVYKEYSYDLMDSGLAMTATCLIMIAMDLSSGKVWFGRDGSWQGNPAAGTGNIKTLDTGSTYFVHCYHASNSTFSNYELHTKSPEFQYSPPSGFSAWE